MTTIWQPLPDGNPIADLGSNLELYGDELSLREGPCLVTVDLGSECRLCVRVDGPVVSDDLLPIIRRWRDMVNGRAEKMMGKPTEFIGRMLLDEIATVDAWLRSLEANDG